VCVCKRGIKNINYGCCVCGVDGQLWWRHEKVFDAEKQIGIEIPMSLQSPMVTALSDNVLIILSTKNLGSTVNKKREK
jgi:hypothetical protein